AFGREGNGDCITSFPETTILFPVLFHLPENIRRGQIDDGEMVMDPLLMIHQAPVLLEEWTGFLSTEIVPIHRPNSYRVCPENVVPSEKT
ncbi:MAG: hypothetical protein LUQ61_04495, partial [Methanoregulaceae archaeon]|nr:hypothetical protein [Methanoregulaceae archaeon]